ncbi:MAG: 4Fe-4S dicluster domain-containing protein, partial [Formivibrio sp.]|nr:4Fe-4S dicluster domain-containing protein [Formivibrio sp.]
MAACTLVHKVVGLQGHPRLAVTRNAKSTAPVLCRHCEDAPCAKVCPVNAITHEGDAIVLNETTCIGCKLCAIACPFGAITPSGTPNTGVVSTSRSYISPSMHITTAGDAATDSAKTLDPILAWTPGVRAVAVKCDQCAFLETGPECVRVCPTHALFVVDNSTLEHSNDAKRMDAVASLDLPLLHLAPEEGKK